jgi:hypothetical protein
MTALWFERIDRGRAEGFGPRFFLVRWFAVYTAKMLGL